MTVPLADRLSSAAVKSPYAQGRKEVPGDFGAVEGLRQIPVRAGQVRLTVLAQRDAGEGAILLLPSFEDAAGDEVIGIVLGVLVEHHEAAGVFEGQRLEEYAADDGEEGNIGADAEGHDEDGYRREPRCTAEGADADAEVAGEGFEPVPRPRGAGLVAQQRGVAEGAKRGVASLFRVHAGGDVIGGLALNVEAKFVVELCAGLAAPKEHSHAHSELIQPAHIELLCRCPEVLFSVRRPGASPTLATKTRQGWGTQFCLDRCFMPLPQPDRWPRKAGSSWRPRLRVVCAPPR